MRLVVCLAVLLTSLTAHADIVYLRDASRHCGTLIKQTESEIVFSVNLADGATVVRRFPASQIKRVERTAVKRSETPPVNRSPSGPAALAADFEQMLREAYELVDDGDLPAALRALQRVVTRAPPEVLRALDGRVRAARGTALDDFVAGLRIRAALDPPRGQLFELKFATRYEAGALGRQLEPLYRHLLDARYDGRTIEAWAGKRDEYTELRPDARRMVSDARLAAAMIGARVRFDPKLKIDVAERRRLVALRADLARFIAKVSALPGFTSLDSGADDEDDPTLAEARRLAAEQAAEQQSATSQPADE
ncbi:MAG: hypothetical protein KKI02_11240 [Planctomycetes bacterium]|nr:hypothetical protein [Planctomycetota bacterium]